MSDPATRPIPALERDSGRGPSADRRLVEIAGHCLAEYLEKIELATAPLSRDDLWWRPHERVNSIANLILHLEGNLSLWILGNLGGRRFERDRAGEFATRGDEDRESLVKRLRRVVEACRATIADLPCEELDRRRAVQTYRVDGYASLVHAVEHMSYHAGQIVWIAKLRLPAGVALDFYPQHRAE